MTWQKGRREVKQHPEYYRKDMTIDEALKVYEEKANGEYEKHTLVNRKKVIIRLAKLTGVSMVHEIDSALLDTFKNILVDKGLLGSVIYKYLSGISCFLQYFGLRVEIPRVKIIDDSEEKMRECLWTPNQVERLLEILPYPAFRAAVALVYYLAIRVGKDSGKKGYPLRGLLGLNWKDINFEEATIKIKAKGGKTYIRPLHKIAEHYLRQWKEASSKTGPDDPVFISRLNTRMTYHGLHLTLVKWMEIAGWPKEKRHLHAGRHTRATITAIEHGLLATKGLLCQENIASTMKYIHLKDDEYLQELIRPDKVQEERRDVGMKKCPGCGTELTPDRKLCDCGYDFTLHRCPKCGKYVEKESTFCAYCGLRIGLPRPQCRCGHALQKDFRICPNCGIKTEEITRLWGENNLKEWDRLNGSRIINSTETNAIVKPSNLPVLGKSDTGFGEGSHQLNTQPVDNRNCKRFDVMITSDREQITRALEEGSWEIVKETASGEFILRRPIQGYENAKYEND